MGNSGARANSSNEPAYRVGEAPPPKLTFNQEELKAKLTEEEYNVTQNKGIYRLCSAWDGVSSVLHSLQGLSELLVANMLL